MPKNKKYDLEISQSAGSWLAKVTRKVSSKKRVTTLQQDGFKSEELARQWAEKALAELVSRQRGSNQAHLKKRKENEEIQRLRSARRAKKTEQAKLEAAASRKADAELADTLDNSKD